MDRLQQIIYHLQWRRIGRSILKIMLIPALIMFSLAPLNAQIPDSEITGAARDADLVVCEFTTKFIKKGDYRTLESGWNHKLDVFFKAPAGARIKVVRYWAWFLPISEQEQTLDGEVWKKLNLGGFKEIFSWAKMQIKVPNNTYVRYYACPNGLANMSPNISYSDYPLQQKSETVTIYQDDNYQGMSQTLEVGKYDVNQLDIGNDHLSSLRVPKGMHARLFEHAGFQGTFREITTDTSYVGAQWNDRVSSLWVYSEFKTRSALDASTSEIRGDIDGDGADDIVITSPWGIGVLTFTGTSLDSLMLEPNGTRFGGWLLNTDDNVIEGLADIDGDGADDIVITSPWGIGVLTFTGTSLDSLMLEPNGTRFGGWLLNTDDNVIEGLADIDGDEADDIVITSPWGIGVLTFTGTSLDSLMLEPNGTRFGGWLLNTDDNVIEGLADIDGDGADDIVITSPWGIGVLTFTGTSLDSLMLEPNGTRFGGWLLNTDDNVIEGLADIDGDEADDIVITSPWGIGVLTFTGTSLDSLMLEPNGTRFGGWLLNTDDNVIEGLADIDGDGADDIVITSPWGIGVLTFTGTSLDSLMLEPNGTRFGGWLLNTDDNVIEGLADIDGDEADDIVITSPWGIGVLTFTGTSLDSLMLEPNGTRFGGWLLNTDDNVIGPTP